MDLNNKKVVLECDKSCDGGGKFKMNLGDGPNWYTHIKLYDGHVNLITEATDDMIDVNREVDMIEVGKIVLEAIKP